MVLQEDEITYENKFTDENPEVDFADEECSFDDDSIIIVNKTLAEASYEIGEEVYYYEPEIDRLNEFLFDDQKLLRSINTSMVAGYDAAFNFIKLADVDVPLSGDYVFKLKDKKQAVNSIRSFYDLLFFGNRITSRGK